MRRSQPTCHCRQVTEFGASVPRTGWFARAGRARSDVDYPIIIPLLPTALQLVHLEIHRQHTNMIQNADVVMSHAVVPGCNGVFQRALERGRG